jgi:glutamate synthase domain-containing protein 2
VHHCALLLGYGAGVVNPYLAFETIAELVRDGHLPGVTFEAAVEHYIKALNKGILKVMSKMGISTLQSYCGAQIFEAVGLDGRFVAKHFTGTSSAHRRHRLPEFARRDAGAHRRAYAPGARDSAGLTVGGEYQWRRGRRDAPLHAGDGLQAAALDAHRAVRDLQGIHQAGRRSDAAVRDAARAARAAPGDDAGSDRGGRAGRTDRQALRHRRDVRTARSARRRTRRSPSR